MTFSSVDVIHGLKVQIKMTDDAHGHSLNIRTQISPQRAEYDADCRAGFYASLHVSARL